MDLNILWFILIVILLTVYVVLDGFDFGVGMAVRSLPKEDHRNLAIKSIGPFWDGNEVWLVVGGGALFAAFPGAYAAIFSGFYFAFMLLLFCLILRGVSLEFRAKIRHPHWRALCDAVLAVTSTLAALLLGIAAANLLLGVPIGADRECRIGFLQLVNLKTLVCGIAVGCLLLAHGNAWLHLKTEGELHRITKEAQVKYGLSAAALLVLAALVLFPLQPAFLISWALALLSVGCLVLGSFAVWYLQPLLAFAGTTASIVCVSFAYAAAMFPRLAVSNILTETAGQSYSLTIYNTASSEKTLGIMAIIAGIGVPLAIVYFIVLYRVFHGKVRLDTEGGY